jgi:hypothetical protein
VVVPAVPADLDSVDEHGVANAPLYEATGEEALAAETGGFVVIEPIEFLNGFRLTGYIHSLRGCGLHAKGKFVGADAGLEFRRSRTGGEVEFVQVFDFVELPALLCFCQGLRAGR